MKKYIVEFVGVFFISLVLGVSGNFLAVGLLVSLLTILFADISKAQFNPALSLALLLKKNIGVTETLLSVFVQFSGAVAAVTVFYFLFGRTFVLQPQLHINILKPLLAEAMFSFLIVLTYLKTVVSETPVNLKWLTGVAILVSGFTCASLSGGGFNPAIGCGPAFLEAFIKSGYKIAHCWIYLVGPISGSIVAVIFDALIFSKKENN